MVSILRPPAIYIPIPFDVAQLCPIHPLPTAFQYSLNTHLSLEVSK